MAFANINKPFAIDRHINRIVYVDDDSDDHLIFSMALSDVMPSAVLLSFYKCDDAISYLKDESKPLPDIVFLDQNIFGNQNNECLQELKRTARLSGIPVVIYTTGSRDGLVKNAAELGAYKYVLKPIIHRDIKQNLSSIFTECVK